MTSDPWRFRCCHSITGAPLGYLHLSDVVFNDPVSGSVGGLTGKAFIGPEQDRDRLDALTQTNTTAIYVTRDDVYWWGGTITSRDWDSTGRFRTITATHWKGWPYRRIIGPDSTANPVVDVTYGYTATDQLAIAAAIMAFATTGAGTPTIKLDGQTSPVTRDLNWLGSDFRYAGDLIDSMASRDQGFDWTIAVIPDAVSGLPELHFAPYYPARGGDAPVMTCHKAPNGGNYSLEGTIKDSGADQRTRVWTTGAGSPPDRLMALDDDPGLTAGDALLQETVTGYNSVTVVGTLASHAQAERRFRSVSINSATIRVFIADLDPSLYAPGDRVQLIYEDEGVGIDLPAVRIIDRTLAVNPSDGASYALLSLDLNDYALPADTASA